MISKESNIVTFFHIKAKNAKFDLAMKSVKVTQELSFEQTILDLSPKCYIPSFVEIGPLVPRTIFFL